MTLRSLCLLALVSTVPTVASAQYFGQNRVMYTKFEFEIIHTKHFDIYFYPREREASLDAARMAERSYGRLSTLLNHQFIERKPIILYASHSDFQQTNALGGDISEATGGVTDFMKHRAIMPFTGAYKDFDHVLMHEMVHQFQYDTWSHGKAGSGVATIIQVNPPLWFAEGMAEYLSLGEITPETAMWLRDAVLQGKLPTIQQLTYDPYIFPYRFGHALWAYIGMRWGDEAVGAILSATLGGGGIEGAFQRVLGITLPQLSVQWRDWVPDDLPARRRRPATGLRGGQAAPDAGRVGRHPARGAGALAGRQADRLPERAELLLHRLLSGRRPDRQGHQATRQVGLRRQLRDLPVPELERVVVAGQQVPGVRRQGRGLRQHRRVRPSAEQGRPPDPREPERHHLAGVQPRRQAVGVQRAERRHFRPLRRQRRRIGPPPADQRQVRPADAGLVARRAHDRLRDRRRAGDELHRPGVRQPAGGALRPRRRAP